jgi:hypothetical protein
MDSEGSEQKNEKAATTTSATGDLGDDGSHKPNHQVQAFLCVSIGELSPGSTAVTRQCRVEGACRERERSAHRGSERSGSELSSLKDCVCWKKQTLGAVSAPWVSRGSGEGRQDVGRRSKGVEAFVEFLHVQPPR